MNHYQADQEIPEDDVYDYDLWDLNRILVSQQNKLSIGEKRERQKDLIKI